MLEVLCFKINIDLVLFYNSLGFALNRWVDMERFILYKVVESGRISTLVLDKIKSNLIWESGYGPEISSPKPQLNT